MNSLMLKTATRLITWLILAFSIYLLLRGHDHPGGGFVGGLVATGAVTLQGMANGVAAARRLLLMPPRTVLILGMGVSAFAGLAGPATGQPFLTGVWIAPLGVPLGSPLLFDLGVYMVVSGAISGVVLTLEEGT